LRVETKAIAIVPLLLAAAPLAITVAPPERDNATRFAANMDRLVAAYPQALVRHDGRFLYWRSGPPTAIAPAAPRSAQAVLANPAIADIFAWDYPRGASGTGSDPGRARPDAFFKRLYGDCRAGGVTGDMVTVRWVGGKSVRFTSRQGAAAALGRVARDLEALGPSIATYLWPTAGTYNCRVIAGTNQLSMHSYGAAIDLNPKYGAYWRWSKRPAPAQTIPASVIAAFERHGFIWGGKWAHFDSFHFEYRPELFGR
jgi:hypothetical protein